MARTALATTCKRAPLFRRSAAAAAPPTSASTKTAWAPEWVTRAVATVATVATAAAVPPRNNYFSGISKDDINYVHSINYEAVQSLINDLPPGWRRLDPADVAPEKPPYLHESGKTSWKNPNLDKVLNMADEHHARQKRENEGSGVDSKQIKKLRLMLQAGAPLGAVEQKARLEGVDMALVLSPSEGKEEKVVVSENEEEVASAIPETLVKKYKRMIKAGVPMDRVQQLAGVEAGATPEKVASILKVQGESDGVKREEAEENKKSEDRAVANPRMSKFLRMQKAGIPLAAIQNAARLQGHDMKELNEALGVEVKEEKKREISVDKKVPVEPSSAEPSDQHFTLQKGAVAFPSFRGGKGAFPLTDLVRKMAQTVQKTSQFSVGSVVVDELTLYHALGALKGVQFARNEYNSTLSVKGMDAELVHSKRHGFLEMARSIGMTLPEERVNIEGLDELVQQIETVNKENLEQGRSLLKDGYYDFYSLHTLYPPGSYVVAKHAGGGGVDSMCQVVWHRYTQGRTISGKPMKYFQVSCRFIVPVGGGMSTFAEVVEGIEMFEGRRSLAASASGAGLAFVPPTGQELPLLLQRYNRRGAMYNRITSPSHSFLEYEKGCFFQKHGGGSFNAGKSSVALAASGRLVVDFDAASDNGHSISVGRDDLVDGIKMKLKEYKLHLRLMNQSKGSVDASRDGKAGSADAAGGLILLSKVPDEYLAVVWPTTVGFSLTSKSWGDVVIDGLGEIAFDADVFNRLVIADSRKRLIKALVQHTAKSGFHDLVEGKGEGTVFLLYGLPGTGKTLTAEALAESLRRPLYSVSMGTLGTTADELERRLSEILDVCARWDALVLLDEADSFLEARSSNSPLERNAMVSVMLRLVEYHRGILFLTSNRIDSLDPAFQTRITLALRYEPLDADGRAQVWANLLVKSGKSLDSIDVKALARAAELNGREIKNALRLAMALAADEAAVSGEVDWQAMLTQELLFDTIAVVDGHKDTMKSDWKEEEAKPSGWLSWWR